jgi:hypothetical protein
LDVIGIYPNYDVFNFDLFIQKNNLSVFAFYSAANRFDFVDRGGQHLTFCLNAGSLCEHLLCLTLLSRRFTD